MTRSDVMILGGGLIGLALASALDASGLRSIVVDPVDPASWRDAKFDGRTSAVSSSSRRMLDTIGVGDHFPEAGCPIRTIRVADGLAPGSLTFEPPQGDNEPLGWMHENRHLRAALKARAEAGANIELRWNSRAAGIERGEHGVTVRLGDGSELAAPLLAVAEGRNSPTREEAGIAVAKWDYRHRAIITVLTHAKPHEGVAWEIFYPAGPFALLPMLDKPDGSHRSALVWTVNERDAAGVLALSDRAFIAEVEKRMHGLYGAIAVDGPRSSYPLGFHHTAKITAQRLALVGDAGHGLHPIAGQGLNVGLRDVGALVEVIVEGKRLGLDPADAQLLTRYERWRGLDTFMVALATDGLTRLFGIPGRIPSTIRRLGMGVVQRTPGLKSWFMDEARGASGQLPELLRG